MMIDERAEKARIDQIVNEAVLRIGNLESDELYSAIVREAVIAGMKVAREACEKIADEYEEAIVAYAIRAFSAEASGLPIEGGER
jgi:hypothetical protein